MVWGIREPRFVDVRRLWPGRTPWSTPPTGTYTPPSGAPSFKPTGDEGGTPRFHGRHGGRGGTEGENGQSGNIAWVDGHVASFVPVRYSSYASVGLGSPNTEAYAEFNIGDIDPNDDDIRDDDFWDLN